MAPPGSKHLPCTFSMDEPPGKCLEAACTTGDGAVRAGAVHADSDSERPRERRETCRDLVKSDLSGEGRGGSWNSSLEIGRVCSE